MVRETFLILNPDLEQFLLHHIAYLQLLQVFHLPLEFFLLLPLEFFLLLQLSCQILLRIEGFNTPKEIKWCARHF